MSEMATYRVPRMNCEHCERAVSEELTAIAGVESVAIDLDSKLVRVTGESLDDGALRSAIVEAGYEAQ
jgi:copper chaperone